MYTVVEDDTFRHWTNLVTEECGRHKLGYVDALGRFHKLFHFKRSRPQCQDMHFRHTDRGDTFLLTWYLARLSFKVILTPNNRLWGTHCDSCRLASTDPREPIQREDVMLFGVTIG